MSGPARAGLFIYAKELQRIAEFYRAVAQMHQIHCTDELIVLESPDIQLVIHKIPEPIARRIVITSPPQPREDTALKFFFTVPSLTQARSTARQHGGAVYDNNWQGPGFTVCNAIDPEGNLFQIRENIV